MSLAGKVRWTVRHPAFAAQPVASLARLTSWRVRTALGVGATVPVAWNGMRFWCPPEWRGNARLTYLWRDAYEAEIALLHRWVGPGDVAVDVGAHYGAYTLPLARLVGSRGQVVAVEPAGHARSVLSRNLRINGLHNVVTVAAAAGSEKAHAILHLHRDRSRASLGRAPHAETAGAEPVEVVPLDDVVPADRPVALVKIDAEGSELSCLKGASALLGRDRPVVVFEYMPAATAAAGVPVDGAWDHLASLGYAMHRVTDQGALVSVEKPGGWHGRTGNVVAIHPDGKARER